MIDHFMCNLALASSVSFDSAKAERGFCAVEQIAYHSARFLNRHHALNQQHSVP
jgi:hypothetical protein